MKATGEARLTIAEAARLLDVTTSAITDQVGRGRWDGAYDPADRTLDRDAVIAVAIERYRELRGRVGRIEASAFEFGVQLPGAGDAPSPERLRAELDDERRGRAVAEARIVGLESTLRRANRAIDALRVDPDVTLDDLTG